jgi:hypothetical protein
MVGGLGETLAIASDCTVRYMQMTDVGFKSYAKGFQGSELPLFRRKDI